MKFTTVVMSLVVIGLAGSGSLLQAIPSEITYQGTLREKGVPVNAPAPGGKKMQFRITNQNGTQVYWSSGDLTRPVYNGLFSATLAPTGVSWETITPYMEVTIEGVTLQPREALTATIYANVAGRVIPGSITPASLSPATKDITVPVGMIAMFATACPPGWTRFSALDDKFPMGANTYGTTGGAAQHTHGIDPDGAHSHTTSAVKTKPGNDPSAGWVLGPATGWVPEVPSTNTSQVSNHDHGALTRLSSSLPPYLTLVFCRKD